MADNPNACGPPEWAARLDALCDHFPFVSEAHVLTMLTAAQGDAEVVAECLSEYPAARLFERWTFPGEFDACGLWRPVPQTAEPPAKFNWKHPEVVGDGPNGCPRRFVGIGSVRYPDAMAQVGPAAQPRRVHGDMRVWAQTTWGW